MNTGTQAAKEAGNMVDLDSDPTKLMDIVEIGKQLLITRGSLTTFSIANDVAKYFAIIPAMFARRVPGARARLNIMQLHNPHTAILSAVIFNAIIIVFLIPLALRGVKFKAMGATAHLRRNILIYGVGGIIAPFILIKLIDLLARPRWGCTDDAPSYSSRRVVLTAVVAVLARPRLPARRVGDRPGRRSRTGPTAPSSRRTATSSARRSSARAFLDKARQSRLRGTSSHARRPVELRRDRERRVEPRPGRSAAGRQRPRPEHHDARRTRTPRPADPYCVPVQATDKDGNAVTDKAGNPMYEKNKDGTYVCDPNTVPERMLAYRAFNHVPAQREGPRRRGHRVGLGPRPRHLAGERAAAGAPRRRPRQPAGGRGHDARQGSTPTTRSGVPR